VSYRARRHIASIWDHTTFTLIRFLAALGLAYGTIAVTLHDLAAYDRATGDRWGMHAWIVECDIIASIVWLGLIWLLWPWSNLTQVLVLRSFWGRVDQKTVGVVRAVGEYFGRVDALRCNFGADSGEERYGLSGSRRGERWKKGIARLMNVVELVVLDVSKAPTEEEMLRHPPYDPPCKNDWKRDKHCQRKRPDDELTGRTWELCELIKRPKTPRIFISHGRPYEPMLASEKRVKPDPRTCIWTDEEQAQVDEMKSALEQARDVLAAETIRYDDKSDREFAEALLDRVEQVCKVRPRKWARHRARVSAEYDASTPAAGGPT
jgi:hypothetical protein